VHIEINVVQDVQKAFVQSSFSVKGIIEWFNNRF